MEDLLMFRYRKARTHFIVTKPSIGILLTKLIPVFDVDWCSSIVSDARFVYINSEYLSSITDDEFRTELKNIVIDNLSGVGFEHLPVPRGEIEENYDDYLEVAYQILRPTERRTNIVGEDFYKWLERKLPDAFNGDFK